jgi:O-antigen ligase
MIQKYLSNFPMKDSIADFGLLWIIFFSIFYQSIAPIGFLILVISLFFNSQNLSLPRINNIFRGGPSIWFLIYYLILLLGLLWTKDISFGLLKLENKLTFLLFPILFQICKFNITFEQVVNVLFISILLSLVSSNILAFINTENLSSDPKWNLFEKLSNSKSFCWNMHRSYFAAYCNVLVVLMFQKLKFMKNKKNKFISIFGIIIGSLGVIQSLSKINILILFLLFAVFLVIFIVKKLKFREIVIFSSLYFFSLFLTFQNKAIKYRFSEIRDSTSVIKYEKNTSLQSSAVRIIMWYTSWEVWKESFLFGTGTGDYNSELTSRNFIKGNYGVAHEQLNSHNQFLNTGVQLGAIGVFVLFMLFISSIRGNLMSSWRVLILIVFFFNFLVESFLETQSGVVLFCILILLFFTPKSMNDLNEKIILFFNRKLFKISK